MSDSEFNNQAMKRMRLGTKSCAECRRRKVRCIFPEQTSKTCQNCATHQTVCKPQQVRPPRQHHNTGKDDKFQQRLEELERVIRNINQNVGPSTNPSDAPSKKDINAVQALDILNPPDGAADSEISSAGARPPRIPQIEDSPLINFVKQVVNIQKVHTPIRQIEQWATSKDPKTIMQALRALTPEPNDLTLIFEHTQAFWYLWWSIPPFSISDTNQSPALIASRWVVQSMQSENPTYVARAATWFALCLQQLSSKINTLNLQFPGPLETILNCFVRGAGVLLRSFDTYENDSLETECLMLYSKLCVNMGRPTSAWHNTRRAVNAALFYGLNRKQTGSADYMLWCQAWQTDRHLSMLLGFPPAVPELYVRPPSDLSQQSIPVQVMYHASLIAGYIGERNYVGENADYGMTLKIEEDLRRCRSIAPDEWWNSVPCSTTSLSDIYVQTTMKLMYYQLHKLLHLPYLLKDSRDKQYDQSRTACLTACREMLRTYRELRSCSVTSDLMCDLMDYQAFGAAMVLLICLLSGTTDCESAEGSSDWESLQNLIHTLKTLSQTMECGVAYQASSVLEHLSLASQGLYAGMKDYETSVPDWGKIRISKIKRMPRNGCIEPTTSDNVDSLGSKTSPSTIGNTIELSTNYFLPFDQGHFGKDPFGNDELGGDWTAFTDMESSYDWTHMFNSTPAI